MGVIIAILSSILSIFIVLKRLSLIGDGLSHTAFGGLSLGYFLNIAYFDEIQARASGIRTWIFDYMISIAAGIAVIASIPIVGVLVISALLVLPALTSIQIAKSFKQTLILSPIFGLTSVVLGLLLSLVIYSAAGATIVVVGLLIFAVVVGLNKFKVATISRASKRLPQ